MTTLSPEVGSAPPNPGKGNSAPDDEAQLVQRPKSRRCLGLLDREAGRHCRAVGLVQFIPRALASRAPCLALVGYLSLALMACGRGDAERVNLVPSRETPSGATPTATTMPSNGQAAPADDGSAVPTDLGLDDSANPDDGAGTAVDDPAAMDDGVADDGMPAGDDIAADDTVADDGASADVPAGADAGAESEPSADDAADDPASDGAMGDAAMDEAVDDTSADDASLDDQGPAPSVDCEAACAAAGAVCSEGNRCVFDCLEEGSCTSEIRCPVGFNCSVNCEGADSCTAPIACPLEGAEDCNVVCGQDACKAGIECASNSCNVNCANGACRNEAGGQAVFGGATNFTVDCWGDGSCNGGMTCNATNCSLMCNGSGACQGGAIAMSAENATLQCNSNGTCDGGVNCSAGNCNVSCNGSGACSGDVNCSNPSQCP